MDIFNAFEEILEHIQEYYGHQRMLIIVLFCILLTYLYFSEIKRKILYPTLFIVFLILNPVLYELVFYRIIYWRLLWMVLGTYIIAYTICQLVKTGTSFSRKMVILCVMCLFIAFSGDYVYTSDNFKVTQNQEKLDKGTVAIGRIILENCDNPKCIIREKYLSQIRQYSADIELLYGRNTDNFISGINETIMQVAREMERKKPDYAFILEHFEYHKCSIIVVSTKAPISDKLIAQYGLYELARIDGSIVYKKDR